MLREFLRHLSLELYRSPETVAAYSTDLHGFNEFIKSSGVDTDDAGFFIPSQVTTADIREWIVSLSEEGLQPSSLRRKIQSLRAYFKYLMKRGVVDSNPALAIPLPKKMRKLPDIASIEDVKNVISSSEKLRDRVIFEMLAACGLRRSELLGIVDSDINFHSAELRVTGKGSKTRIIPLQQPLLVSIREWQQERDRLYPELPAPKPLIATMHGAMSKSCLYKIVNRGLQSTTAARKSPHTLRHTFATGLLNSGAEINSVKELLGHSSLGATQIYTHLAFADLKANYLKAHPRSKKSKNQDSD